jgi:hypothetical protein
MPLTQTQLASAVADRAELSKTDAKRALAALEDVVLEQLGNASPTRAAVVWGATQFRHGGGTEVRHVGCRGRQTT